MPRFFLPVADAAGTVALNGGGKPTTAKWGIRKNKTKNDMKYLTIDYIKQHSRIDFDCEDDLLEMYGDAAEDAIAQVLNRGKDAEAMVADLTEVYGRVPAPIYVVTFMLVDSIYQNRGKDLAQEVRSNPTFALLLKPYMKL